MTSITEQIIKNMSDGMSLNEIKEVLNLPDKMFLDCLKQVRSSYQDFQKKVLDNGTVFYLPKDPKLNLNPNRIELVSTKDTFRAIFISDLHCGNKKDTLELLDIVYEHAIAKGINIIINTGDVIENVYCLPPSKLKQKTIEGQVKRLIKTYPYSPSITNLILYGNHDHKALTEHGLDIASMIENERYDLMNLSYGEAVIKIKKDEIALQHNLTNRHHTPLPPGVKVIFKGHSHKMKYDLKKGQTVINVPALSDAAPESYEYPHQKGFLDVEITFKDDDEFDKVYIKHFILNPKKTIASEFTLSLRRNNYHQ